MSAGTTVAITVLIMCAVLVALIWRARGVAPLILAGVVLGLAAGIAATLLAAGLT